MGEMMSVPGGLAEMLPSHRRRLALAALSAVLLITSLLAFKAPPAASFGSSEPPPLPSVSAGGYMTCAVQADGTAACWGENGVPSNDVANVSPGGAATPPAGVRFLEVNAGYATACGITTEQAVVCWGNDRFGKVTRVPPGTYTHVVPGLNYVCALRTDAAIACWGGDDPAAPGADPDQRVVRDVPSGVFTQLTMGIRHACAQRADGIIVCWGHNADGQTNVPPGTYTQVNAGNFTTCAIRTDGTAICWGRNQGGQQTVPAGTFTQLSVGFAHVCGLRPDGTITCWGRSSEGQATPPAGTFTHVSAGTFHSCAMATSGPPAVCWGNNQAGRVQPSMTAAEAPLGTVGDPYAFQLTMATHVAPSPTFSVIAGDLPPGVTLSPEGLLSGTPTASGTYQVTVAASNGLSPTDCVVGATGTLPCTPGDPTSVATATRVFTIEVIVPKASPTITTQASPGNLLGAPVRDVATVAGGVTPTGTVTFRLFSDATCTTQVFTSTNPLAGNTATSDWFTPAAPGTYHWTAVYSGDANNHPATSPCGAPNESVTIAAFVGPAPTQTVSGDFAGPLTVNGGQSVVITNARVVGPVTVNPGGSLTVANSQISRGITANAPAFFSLCGTQVSGPSPAVALSVTNAAVPVRIGDPAAGCAGNRFAGQVNLSNNLAVTFGANIVSHNATINDNGHGNTVIKANNVFGALGCSGNDPAPTNAGQPNTAGSKTGQCSAL